MKNDNISNCKIEDENIIKSWGKEMTIDFKNKKLEDFFNEFRVESFIYEVFNPTKIYGMVIQYEPSEFYYSESPEIKVINHEPLYMIFSISNFLVMREFKSTMRRYNIEVINLRRDIFRKISIRMLSQISNPRYK